MAKQSLKGVPPQNQIMVEPGDNSKFLIHAMKIRQMPPIDVADIRQVEERITWYFNHCAEDDIKPTVSGFCNSLGITRQTLLNWRTGVHRADTHQAVILNAYSVLEELWENYMQNGKINPVSGIFLAKNNFGYQDKQDIVVTPNNNNEVVDVKTIEAKYAELPDYGSSIDDRS